MSFPIGGHLKNERFPTGGAFDQLNISGQRTIPKMNTKYLAAISSHNFFPLSSPLKMPLYKVWGEDGAKRKAVVAQDFNDFVLKGKRRNLYINL